MCVNKSISDRISIFTLHCNIVYMPFLRVEFLLLKSKFLRIARTTEILAIESSEDVIGYVMQQGLVKG